MPWPMAPEALQPSACMELSLIPLTAVRVVGTLQFYYRQIRRSPSTAWPMAMGCSWPLDITNRLNLPRSELSYTSVDGGASWMQQASIFTLPAMLQPPFNNITFANGLFVAVSNDSGNGGDIFVSPDGVKWTQSTIAAPSLNTLVYGNYQYIAVGDGGEILGSQLPAASGASFYTVSGCFSFVVCDPPGTYGVYYSNDLSMPLPWNFVQNTSFTSTSYSTTVVDCNAGNSPNGFYYLGPKGP